MTRRAMAFAVVVLAGLTLPVTGAGAAAASDASRTEAVPQPPSPADVEIPYLGDASIEPAAPWRVVDCAAVAAASPLVTGCDAHKISLAAPQYDPEAGVVVIPVALTNDAVSTTVGYRVRLAGPETPSARPAEAPWPVAAGSLLRVPISELGVECAVCTAGGRLEALEVEPASAGSVWATPTHLVFRAATGYTGPAEVGFRFADDYGSWSADARVHAAVYRAVDAPLVTLDRIAAIAPDGTAAVDLAGLVSSIAGDDVVLVGCGAAIHGRAACEGGTASYTGPPGVVDQFSVQFAASGEQATASVTLVPEPVEPAQPAEGATEADDVPRPTSGLVALAPPDQTDGVTTWLDPPTPVEHHDSPGIFSPLISTLDRVGAR